MTNVHPHVRAQMEAAAVDVLVLCGENNVAYATGHVAPSHEPARGSATRTVAIVTEDVRLYPAPWVDIERGAQEISRVLADYPGALAIDEYPTLALFDALRPRTPLDAAPLLSAAKIVKTAEEVERIRRAQRINEEAMDVVRTQLAPGGSQLQLTATFFREVFARGASGNTVDPVWDVVPRRRNDVFSLTGDLPFPTPTAGRVLARGDVIFSDTGIDLDGWASDFGRTWTVGTEPNAQQRDQFARWCEIRDACCKTIAPGATAHDVARAAIAANGGVRPWFPHLYVAHGIGTDPAELPFCGTDLGAAAEDEVVLAPGMVLVLEPVVWDEGEAGYRAEEIVAVTADGCERLTDYTYEPYG
jgi:Xaa-Pro aminopeptidase